MTIEKWYSRKANVEDLAAFLSSPAGRDLLAVIDERTPRLVRGTVLTETNALIELGHVNGYRALKDFIVSLAETPVKVTANEQIISDFCVKKEDFIKEPETK